MVEKGKGVVCRRERRKENEEEERGGAERGDEKGRRKGNAIRMEMATCNYNQQQVTWLSVRVL